jgi:hypothetical protein
MGEVINFRAPTISLGLSAFDRAAIEAKIEELIALLDDLDGDADLEPEQDMCAAGDDGCGFHRAGERRGWGADDDARYFRGEPLYGVDQTKGPLQIRETNRDYERGGER